MSPKVANRLPKGAQNGAKIAQKRTFAQNARPHFLLLFTTLGGHGASQEEPKSAPKPHQKINRFSNLEKSPKKLPMAPKRAPN
jgi:hypothetical protein